MDLDHVGIATDDAGPLVDQFAGLFDLPVVHEETIDDLAVTFLDAGGGYLEVLEPVSGAAGPIPRYLSSRGAGIHHLAFATDDLPAALEAARAAGVSLVDSEPRAGAWGHDVAFLHPDSTGGILVELVEH